MQANILQIWMTKTLISDNGPCYTAEVFTNLMREYNVNNITSSAHYTQSNGLAEKHMFSLSRTCFIKLKRESTYLKCLMLYCNTPLSNTLWSPMQILSSRSARSDLPISNAARKQLGIDCEDLRTKYKNEHLPLHDLHIDQTIMYKYSTSKQMVSSYHHKTVQWTQRLHNYNQRRCPIQERHKCTWYHINPKARRVKMNIYHNLIICGQSNL